MTDTDLLVGLVIGATLGGAAVYEYEIQRRPDVEVWYDDQRVVGTVE